MNAAAYRLTGHRLEVLQFAFATQMGGDPTFTFADLERAKIGGRCPWKRVGECRDMGWLEQVPGKRIGQFGAYCDIYQITDQGRAAIGRWLARGEE